MAWFNLGWLQVLWFVVVVYAVTAAAVHLCLRRLLRRRLAAEAEARGERPLAAEVRPLPVRIRRAVAPVLVRVRSAASRARKRLTADGATVTVLPRPHAQVPQIAARPSRPAPTVGLSEGTPTMAIALLPRQRVIDLAGAERSQRTSQSQRTGGDGPADDVESRLASGYGSDVDSGPVRWWHGVRG